MADAKLACIPLRRNELTADYARGALAYNPDTGELTWRHRADQSKWWNASYAGKHAGTTNYAGYRCLRIGGRHYRCNRIIYLMMTGNWPEQIVDHINGIKGDDRWSNLRSASFVQNIANSGVRTTNKVGVKGVHLRIDKGGRIRWRACIRHNGKTKNLGYYDSPTEAGAAYQRASRMLHGEFSR